MYGSFKNDFYGCPYANNLIEKAQAEGSDGFIYLNDTILAAYYGSEETVKIKEGTVTVADRAFSYSSNVKHIICPESLRYVGVRLHFATEPTFPSTLESIELNEGLEVIGTYAFTGASNLTDITIPDSAMHYQQLPLYRPSPRMLYSPASSLCMYKAPCRHIRGRPAAY